MNKSNLRKIDKAKVINAFQKDPKGVLNKMGLADLKQVGQQGNLRCPFHEDNSPSLSINLKNGLWKCWAGCGEGDLFTLYGRINGLCTRSQFPEILNRLNSHCAGGAK